MKFRTFYLFYILSILLFVLGLLTKEVVTINGGWHATTTKGMWSFFLPASVGALSIAFVYHYWFRKGRPVRSSTVLIHFSLVVLGLAFSPTTYRWLTTLNGLGRTGTTAISTYGLQFMLLGTIFLVASVIVFVVGLKKSKRALEFNNLS